MVEHTRTLGFRVAFAMGLGTMIAAGIFSLSGTAVATIGSSAVIAFIIAALVASITAASYSEFASIYSENGGGYLFSSRTFEDQDLLTYAIGASLFIGYSGTTAFYLATMDEWFFAFILPEWLHFLPHGTVGVLAAVALGTLNAQGTEESGTFQLLVTGAKVAVLFAFIGGAFVYTGVGQSVGTFATSFQIEPVSIVSIAALAFITFFGFSAIAASAGEIIEPRKTVPKAIAASIVTVTILYTFVIIAMVNAPVPNSVLQAGETAMGKVAAAFLGPAGQALIVAGAVFSMISASNASVLAASGIGSLMGQQGQAPRRFSRIHPEYGTPFWSVATCTGVIVALIVAFLAVFPHQGSALFGVHLGLEPLTGFATLNLLLPLSAVNLALIYSRRKYPDMDRPLTVPLVPVVPALGIVANLALIYNLPTAGVVIGAALIVVMIAAYLAWGGNPAREELAEEVVPPAAADGAELDDRYTVVVPLARPSRAPGHVRLAETLASAVADDPFVQVVNVTELAEQTPQELVNETAEKRADAIRDELAAVDVDVDYSVEGHLCRDVAFDIVNTARDDQADLIVMGYPEEHREITEAVEYKAPCDVVFASDAPADGRIPALTVGAGGGPHHRGALTLAGALGTRGTNLNLVNVRPSGGSGTEEDIDESAGQLPSEVAVDSRTVDAATIAEGLVDVAREDGSVLMVGASRTRRLQQWILGSTPDRVVRRAAEEGVPVLVYAAAPGTTGWFTDRGFTAYRFVRKLFDRRQRTPRPSESQS